MSLPFTTNRFLPVNIKGDDNIVSDLNGNVSLLCNGKVALYGNTTLSAGKVLAIGKSPQSATYHLDVSGNIQYSGNLYKAGVIQDKQDYDTIQVLSASAIVILNKNFVYHGINNNTITTIRLPNENTLTVGHRFVVFPMQNWSSLATSVTVNCESEAQILDVSAGVVSVQMSSNNPYVEFICIATTGTVRWATINRDPQRLLSGSNTWTGSNTFAGSQLRIDTSTNLTLLGNIVASNVTITPAMVSFLSIVRFFADRVSIGQNASLGGAGGTVSMGSNALKNMSGVSNVAIGTDALSISSVIGYGNNTAVGYQAGIISNSSNCTYIGAKSGVGHTNGGELCTFLGASAGSNGAGSRTASTAIGYNSRIDASNQVMLGTSTENVVCPGTLRVQSNLIATASPTIITTTTDLSGVLILFRYYSVTSASPYAITLPVAAVGYLGCTITFRRVGATISNAITSASANIYAVNSLTPTDALLPANVCQVTICCMVITTTPTYGWVLV